MLSVLVHPIQEFFNRTSSDDRPVGPRPSDDDDSWERSPGSEDGPHGDNTPDSDDTDDAPGNGSDDDGNSGSGRRGGRSLLSDSGHGNGGGRDHPEDDRPPHGWPLPHNITECPAVSLVPADAIVEGSAGCQLGDCLPCAGLEGCVCVDCRCQCSL